MKRDRDLNASHGDEAARQILPFPSTGYRSTASELVVRELGRLVKQVQPRQLAFSAMRRWNELRRWQNWLTRPQTPFRAVFVIASPRSGSNLLLDYLRQLPGIGCLGEVLNWGSPIGPKKLLHPHQVLKHLQQSLHTLPAPQRVCKMFVSELEHYRLAIDDLERTFQLARYLLLYRENLAEQFVSEETAKRTGQWILFPGQRQIRLAPPIDAGAFTQYSQEMWRRYNHLAAHRAIAHRGAAISYEQLVNSPSRCLREIVCPLLDLPFVEPQTHLCKQNVEPIAQRVANYNQVAGLLTGPLATLQIGCLRPPAAAKAA